MAFTGSGGVWATKVGDFQPTNFAGTQSGIQAALDYCNSPGGHVHICAGAYTGITNLTAYGWTTISGDGPKSSLLTRSAAATGAMLREKTVGEGNPYGASGIVVRDLALAGNGSVGNGIDLGNQGGSSFTSNAYLSDIIVGDFPTGTAIKLLPNAIHCRDIWAVTSQIGLWIVANGGASHFDGVWAENCTGTHVKIESPWNTWVHLQIEQTGAAPSGPLVDLLTNGDQNVFVGTYMALRANMTNLFIVRTGCLNTQLYGTRVVPNGFTWTNTVYTEGTATGTGAPAWIGFFNDMSTGGKHYFNDQNSGETTVFTGARPVFPTLTTGAIINTGISTLTGDIAAGVAGSGYSATFGQGAAGADSSSVNVRSGTGGVAQFLLNQNNVALAGLRYAGGGTFLDHGGTLTYRNGISGPTTASLDTSGNLILTAGLTFNTIRQQRLGTNIASAATIAIPVDGDVFHVTGATNITNGITVNAADAGRTVVLIFDSTPTVTDTGTSKLNGNFVATADDTLTLKCDGTSWFELARSAN